MRKAFMPTLMELRSGAVVEEATNELNTLVAMVRDTGKAGKITITLEVNSKSNLRRVMRRACQ